MKCVHDISISDDLPAGSSHNLSTIQSGSHRLDVPMIDTSKSPVKSKPTRALNSPNFRVDPQSPSRPDTPERYSYFWPEGQKSPRSRPMKAIYVRKLNFDF